MPVYNFHGTPLHMAEAILENTRATVEQIGTADILVGIPTFNDVESIVPLVKAVYGALRRFSHHKCVVAQVDGGSTDGTIERAIEAAGADSALVQTTYPIYPAHRLSVSERGAPGRESAYRTILSLAQDLSVRSCCVVEPGLPSITPDWISSLVQPTLEGYDFVAPHYQRHKYEGLLVNGILYPVIRALYGKRLRHPVGRDFGFSGVFVRHCLSSELWNRQWTSREIDLWMNIQAVSSNVKICQARLGARPRARKEASSDISAVLAQVAGELYTYAEETAGLWQRIRASQPIPLFGLRFDSILEVAAVDATGMKEAFEVGSYNLIEIWAKVLSPAALLEIKKASRLSLGSFSIADEFWARIVYDFAVAHRQGSISRDHLLRALTPLYMGWAASYILSVKDASSSQAEERIERLALAFEQQKPYLISRWRWPDRFLP